MKGQIYLRDVVTLGLDADKCIGCGLCVTVCPHRVLAMKGDKAFVVERDACMECGACSGNCPVEAISVESGVGCAVAIFKGMLNGGKRNRDTCCESSKDCS